MSTSSASTPTELSSIAAADALLAQPGLKLIFKHSTACGTSAWAFEQFSDFVAQQPGVSAAIVVVQHSRQVSNHLATALGAIHQSPQALLVRGGSAPQLVWKASHYGITTKALADAWTAASTAPA